MRTTPPLSLRGLCLAAIVALIAGLAWLRIAAACCWEPGPSVRFNRLHAHSPLAGAELDCFAWDPGCFLDADLVREAYAKEEAGDLAGSVAVLRGVEKDALRALACRRAERFYLHPLDVARTRIRVADAAPGDALPLLAACRAFERSRIGEAKGLLREGGPLAEEWLCLAGLIAETNDPKAAGASFAKGTGVRARWLLARAQREAGEVDASLATLQEMRKRTDLGGLADDVMAEIGRCHALKGDLVQAARDYEAVLTQFPEEDMRQAAQESLLYIIYPSLRRDGKAAEIPAGVPEYLEGLGTLLACGLAWSEYPDDAEAHFEAALAKGPAWLRENALYRTAMCATPKAAARKLRTLLSESPEGPFAPVAHYLLAQYEGGVKAADLGIHWGPRLNSSVRKGSGEREWDHLWAVTTKFPASQWAPAALTLLVRLAQELGREDEAIEAAGHVFRAQPMGQDLPFCAMAMRRIRAWVMDRTVSLDDVKDAGFLDRYLLDAGMECEMFQRCPDSPLALRALVAYLNGAEGMRDRALGEEAQGWCAAWQRESVHGAKPEEDVPTGDHVEVIPDAVLSAASGILERAKGGDPFTLASAWVQLARARLAAGDAMGAREAAQQAVGFRLDPWYARAWEVRGRADLALGRLADAEEAARMLGRPMGDDEGAKDFLAELAVAQERAGDRVGALGTYRSIRYDLDADYLAEVICATDELARYCTRNPEDADRRSILWSRLVAEGKWTEALKFVDHRYSSTDDAGRVEETERLQKTWTQVELATRTVDAETRKEIERRVRELGDDDWATREAATKRIVEIGSPAAGALKRGIESDDAERHQRCAELLARIPSDPATAMYRWATVWFELGKDQDGHWGGDIRRLRYMENFLSPEEGKAVQAFLERQHGYFRARRAWQEVADRWPTDPMAAKALYMVGVVNLRMHDLSGTYGVVGPQESFARAAHGAFLDLARRFPKSTLADDGLFWASYSSADPAEKRELRKRVVREYADSDVAQVLFPTGDWEHEPTRQAMDNFRENNRELRKQHVER